MNFCIPCCAISTLRVVARSLRDLSEEAEPIAGSFRLPQFPQVILWQVLAVFPGEL